jgi:hypothetical protein
MSRIILITKLLLVCLFSSGCALLQPMFRVRPSVLPTTQIVFERTAERPRDFLEESRLVTVRFEGCKFSEGMRQLSELTGKPISWDKSLDNEVLIGTFVEQPVSVILDSFSRRFNVSVIDTSGMYFIGTRNDSDLVSAVVRVPPVAREELQSSLEKIVSSTGNAVILGSFIWISDTFSNVQKFVSDLDLIREKSERSYLAEIFFIRVDEDDFLRLTADLRISQVDIFSSSFNVEQLFSMFVNAEGKLGSTVVDTRPVLTLSEGRKATFEVGTEITKERKAVSENNIISTLGYDKFQDGIQLSLLLSRVSDERYSVDMDLEVSSFDKAVTSEIPDKKTSVLRSPGLLVRDGGVVYAGSLKRKDASKVFGIFSLDGARSTDLLTIWVRCREIR